MIQNFPVHIVASGVLGLSVQSFAIQLVTFLIVLLALRQWAFKPILKVLNERREVINSGITLGEKMRAQEASLEEKVSRELHKARQEADKIVSTAQYEARETVTAAEETARGRSEALLTEAKNQAVQQIQRERVKLEKELVGLVSEVSEAIIGEKVDAQKDAALIDKALHARKAASA
ncbi:MAG TPA: F0F1 ATP synthase subunit B [Candidatus Saccharimonadales bacterium]|nr:F0F1 ATP synthase subunit B [Candidatus Saccharimonadales bacterium]